MHTFFEKIAVFNNIVYDDEWHSYTINGEKTVSVTKVTGAAKPPFDEMGISKGSARKRLREEYYAANPSARLPNEDGVMVPYEPPVEQVDLLAEKLRGEWKTNNLVSTEAGSAAHKYIESAMANKFERFSTRTVHASFEKLRKTLKESNPRFDQAATYKAEASVKDKYDHIVRQMDDFKRDIQGKMVPVKSELVIGSPKYMLCGMIDQIFWNFKSKEFELWDWKTNANFETSSEYYLREPVSHLQQCNLIEYSLQLGCYKKMFTEMTGIPLGQSWLCWFNTTEPKYKVFKCVDLPNEVDLLIEKSMKERGISNE